MWVRFWSWFLLAYIFSCALFLSPTYSITGISHSQACWSLLMASMPAIGFSWFASLLVMFVRKTMLEVLSLNILLAVYPSSQSDSSSVELKTIKTVESPKRVMLLKTSKGSVLLGLSTQRTKWLWVKGNCLEDNFSSSSFSSISLNVTAWSPCIYVFILTLRTSNWE